MGTHLNLNQLQKKRKRSLASTLDDRYVVDYHEEEAGEGSPSYSRNLIKKDVYKE